MSYTSVAIGVAVFVTVGVAVDVYVGGNGVTVGRKGVEFVLQLAIIMLDIKIFVMVNQVFLMTFLLIRN